MRIKHKKTEDLEFIGAFQNGNIFPKLPYNFLNNMETLVSSSDITTPVNPMYT